MVVSRSALSRFLSALLVTGGLVTLTGASGCSPLGWYDDAPPHKRTVKKTPRRYRSQRDVGNRTQAPPPRVSANANIQPPSDYQRSPRAPEATARQPAPPVQPAPAPPVAAPPAKPQLQIVQTGRKGMYYIIDRQRKLCFFHNEGAVAQVSCSRLPEAADVKGAGAPPKATPVQPAQPAQPAPPVRTQPAQPAQPAPSQPKKWRGSDRGHAAGAKVTPTDEEATRFTRAYVAVFCDRQKGGSENPRVTIQRHGLSVDRYSEIEGWMAKDERRWRSLTQSALKGCR